MFLEFMRKTTQILSLTLCPITSSALNIIVDIIVVLILFTFELNFNLVIKRFNRF